MVITEDFEREGLGLERFEEEPSAPSALWWDFLLEEEGEAGAAAVTSDERIVVDRRDDLRFECFLADDELLAVGDRGG